METTCGIMTFHEGTDLEEQRVPSTCLIFRLGFCPTVVIYIFFKGLYRSKRDFSLNSEGRQKKMFRVKGKLGSHSYRDEMVQCTEGRLHGLGRQRMTASCKGWSLLKGEVRDHFRSCYNRKQD
jgi:hypothetical protein